MTEKKEKIAFFGGSFDPIHHGHIQIALAALERTEIDEVWFCPAKTSPHKIGKTKTPSAQRLEMVRLAVEPISNCRVLDDEVMRHSVSYTVDTLSALVERYPDKSFYLLLGSEAYVTLSSWKQPERLLSLAKPLLFERSSPLPASEPSIELCDAPKLEISSTEVRQRLSQRLYSAHLVPQSVLDYIETHKLYTDHL